MGLRVIFLMFVLKSMLSEFCQEALSRNCKCMKVHCVVGQKGEASIPRHPWSGTHQSKRRARSITNSTRVLHGISFFITLSPSESQNAIFLRCTRLRQSDPFVMHHPELARWYGRTQPSLLHWESGVSEQYPSHEVRRHILSNSAISCVDGFKAHTTLLFKFVFGLKICPRCPWCTCSDGEGKNNEFHLICNCF